MIQIVVDSNAQMPAELLARFGVDVVPLTVTVDGHQYLEGVDLDADDFYGRFDGDNRPKRAISTSQPSPGQFVSAYVQAAERGAEAILSIHIGSSLSGTVNSARLAAPSSPVPVRIVDTATASFAVALCAWRAAEALADGATLEQAAAAAEAVGATVGNVFVVGTLDLAQSGGRLEDGAAAPGPALNSGGAAHGIPVLTLVDGAMRPIGTAADVAQAADVMVDHVRAAGTGLRVGVGLADVATLGLVEAVETRLRAAPEVAEVIRYRIGPSVGAHTGPDAVGVMFCPTSP